MKIKDFIGEEVRYDEHGQIIFGVHGDYETRLVDVRGWGAIQQLDMSYEKQEAFQDELGQFVADAINEKLAKEN